MRTLVSRNALALIRLVPIEPEALRQRAPERAQPGKCLLTALVARDLETAHAGDHDLDVVALLQIERLDDHLGQANGEAVSPLRDLHAKPPGYTRLMYRVTVGW